MKNTIPPIKYAGLLNSRRVRNPIIDNDCDSDGFWRFGYGNDPKRRRYIRHVERQRWTQEIESVLEER